MSREERLFDAIGGADESLLRRSEKEARRKVSRLEWAVGLAACLAVVMVVYAVLPGALEKAPPVSDNTPPVEASDNLPSGSMPGQQEEDPSGCTLPAEPWPAEEGEWHYLQIRTTAAEKEEPRFRIYINKKLYYSYEQEGVYIIRPRYEQAVGPEGSLSECKLEITHQPDIGVDDALEQSRASLASLYETVEVVPGPPNGWFEVVDTERYLYASDGAAWDAAQREVWIKPDGEGGVFVLTSSYFLEATEGHGARFVDMMETFVSESEEYYPELWLWWETELLDAGERLADAVFAQDFSGVEDLLAPDVEISGYVEDVSGWVSIAGIDYTLTEPRPQIEDMTATISVKHRLGAEEPYAYLMIEMKRTRDYGEMEQAYSFWQATRISITDWNGI